MFGASYPVCHVTRQVHPDHGLHLDDAGGDLDEAEAQRVELGDAPHRTLWHRHAKAPHQPVGARMQEQPKLVGWAASNVSSMSSVIRLGTVAKDSQYRSTIALPIRSRARTSGRFSNRDIVDCEHNSRSMGERSRAILNIGSRRSELASLPSS